MRLVIATCLALAISGTTSAQQAAPAPTGIFMTSEKLTGYSRSYLTLIRNHMRGDVQLNFDAALCNAYVTGVLDAEAFSAGVPASPYVPRL